MTPGFREKVIISNITGATRPKHMQKLVHLEVKIWRYTCTSGLQMSSTQNTVKAVQRPWMPYL